MKIFGRVKLEGGGFSLSKENASVLSLGKKKSIKEKQKQQPNTCWVLNEEASMQQAVTYSASQGEIM